MPHRPGHGTQRQRIERQARKQTALPQSKSSFEASRNVLRDAEDRRLNRLVNQNQGLNDGTYYGCNIEYISVDMGAEKGEGTENTVALVTNFLISQNFGLVDFKESRTTGLFKNLIYN